MISALARFGLKAKQKREDQSLQKRTKDDEKDYAPWLSGTKGDGTAPQLNGTRYFSFKELKQCTNNFSENNEIGEGGYGKVYKGYCSNGVVVAIRRAKKGYSWGRKEFESEIEVLSRVHHKNIVSLVGFCLEQGEQALVYEYMSKGTLRDNLAGMFLDIIFSFCISFGKVVCIWTGKKRLQIALDSARGLAYLHELAYPLIIHRFVKPSNILLDENLNAKVTNFGLSKLVYEKQTGNVSSQGKGTLAHVEYENFAGTIGYIAPEYLQTGLLSENSDVYSFRVVMLELITGRQGCEIGSDETFLVKEVKRVIDQNDTEYYGLRDMIDHKIVNHLRNAGFRKFVQLALHCVEYSASDSPSMYEIMTRLDIILLHDGSERTDSC
ncbi:Leucine-rich repeat protein kinase family protein [Rhynchospora pubera]|uniref:Leucine-rich repeat protein kinase family protein n=1 Tax=Rhynchospora pubera TaxID=906938 RepID=A0AAV8CYU2_9POAL|nr:Leucine-rich repeat protein kinase family protein [Rhynchospora pubera]